MECLQSLLRGFLGSMFATCRTGGYYWVLFVGLGVSSWALDLGGLESC